MIQAASGTQLVRSLEGSVQDSILEALIEEGHLTHLKIAAAQDAREKARSEFGVGYHLVEMGSVGAATVLRLLGSHFQMATVDLANTTLQPDAVRTLPAALARDLCALPFAIENRVLKVAVLDPFNTDIDRRLRDTSGHIVETYLADEYTLRTTLKRAYRGGTDLDLSVARAANAILEDAPTKGQREDETVEKAEVPKLVEGVLEDGVRRGASDIHFEFYEEFGRIRYRIDGNLVEITSALDPRLGSAIVNRIKVKSGLNNSQDRVPEDGTTDLVIDGERHDFRVSTLPTITGEVAVLRVLERDNRFRDLHDFDLSPRDERVLRAALKRPQGMVLVTGPTGSGKSTTLYTGLGMLNDASRKILTVEDPVERRVPGITQVSIKKHEDPKLNLDFATALKAFLRQDPNVIMVGEIRDLETAQIALRASMTGHLVLSTLHTNDTTETVHRLLNLGIEPYNISTAVQVIVAQRLVRIICPQCKVPHKPTAIEIEDSGFAADQLEGIAFYRGEGCDHCTGTGYRGRTGLYEVLEVTRSIRAAIAARASADEIRDIATEEGMTTLRTAALAKLQAGISTLAEVARETNF